MNKDKYVFVLVKDYEVQSVFSSITKVLQFFKGTDVTIILEINNTSVVIKRGSHNCPLFEVWGYVVDEECVE